MLRKGASAQKYGFSWNLTEWQEKYFSGWCLGVVPFAVDYLVFTVENIGAKVVRLRWLGLIGQVKINFFSRPPIGPSQTTYHCPATESPGPRQRI